jgi:hypothetical protein
VPLDMRTELDQRDWQRSRASPKWYFMGCLCTCLLARVSLPGAVQACSQNGKLFTLMHYAGSDGGDFPGGLGAEPLVRASLQRLPPSVQAHLFRNLEVHGPVDLVSCHLALSGNVAHMGGLENAILDVNLYSGAVTVALLSQDKITVYLGEDPTAGSGYNAVPASVRWWVAAAATGFHAVDHPPADTRIVNRGEQ